MRRTILVLFVLVLLPCAASAIRRSRRVRRHEHPDPPGRHGQGTLFGLRPPVTVIPLVTVEPYSPRPRAGTRTRTSPAPRSPRSGMDHRLRRQRAAALGGNPVYPFAGIGSYKLTRAASDDLTKIGYNFGLGLGFSAIPKLSIDVRGELNMTVGETSRKCANVTAGVSYNFFSPRP